jgi:SCY1-like protein 1
MAMMASVDCFNGEDVATKVLPAITGSLVDREKLVREQAFRAMEMFVKRVEVYASQLVCKLFCICWIFELTVGS